ncbi:uncharacterized protein [Littorina saxatilis]|uniref:uncharacterized protein n=1 Tax=Littorina saxatilis TaxID=31220 RepID=UPI0038B5621B
MCVVAKRAAKMTFSPRDTKDVSKLVSKKLERYLNVERREARFDTQGYMRTTPRMKTFDLMYRVLDSTELDNSKEPVTPRGRSKEKNREKSSTRKSKSQEKYRQVDTSRDSDHKSATSSKKSGKNKKKETKRKIQPTVIQNSRRVVTNKEADRITEHANNIFSEQPLDKLQVIHRYRPHSRDIPPVVENGRVQNYTQHFGSALQAKNYVDYYMREGLQTGRKEHSKRLQRLDPSKKPGESTEIEKDRTDKERGSPHRIPCYKIGQSEM